MTTTKFSKILICFLCVLMAVVSVPKTVFAAEGSIDILNDPVLMVEFLDGEKPLSGAKFDIFLIADIDELGNYIPKEGFEHFNISTEGKNLEKWRELAQTIESFVLSEKMLPYDSALTDENGVAEFPSEKERLVCGLYLVVGHDHHRDGYVFRPETALVQLPMPNEEGNGWNYDVTLKPKYTQEPEKEEKEYITRKVLKIWYDKGYENLRPEKITVYLLCDGEIYDTVVLSEENNWRYTWENLEKDHRWSVSEEIPEGYTVKITREGITFIIANTIGKEPPPPENPEKPDEPKLPQTGQLWWPVPVLFGAGIAFVAAGIFRRRSGHEK